MTVISKPSYEEINGTDDKFKRSLVISFYSNRGGAGCTTSVFNTGCLLSNLGFKVVVLELDISSPNLSSFLKESKYFGLVDYMHERFVSTNRIPSILLEDVSIKVNSNLVCIPATYRLNPLYINKSIDLQVSAFIEEDALWRNLRNRICEIFSPDIILIDSNKGFNEWSFLCNIHAADLILYFTPFFEGVQDSILSVIQCFNYRKKQGVNLKVVYSNVVDDTSFCCTEFIDTILKHLQ